MIHAGFPFGSVYKLRRCLATMPSRSRSQVSSNGRSPCQRRRRALSGRNVSRRATYQVHWGSSYGSTHKPRQGSKRWLRSISMPDYHQILTVPYCDLKLTKSYVHHFCVKGRVITQKAQRKQTPIMQKCRSLLPLIRLGPSRFRGRAS